MNREQIRARLLEIKERVSAIHSEYDGQRMPDAAKAEWNTLNEERDDLVALEAELEARAKVIADYEGNERASERPEFHTAKSRKVSDIYDLNEIRRASHSEEHERELLRDNAKRSVENATIAEVVDDASAKAHIERLMERSDGSGEIARRILQTGSPQYRRGFGKLLAGKEPTNEERTALSTSGSAGGYAVPYTLDPTVIPTSNFSVNPYRAISRVVTLTGSNTWQGVSSAGVTASFDAELAEVSDDSPTFSQPQATAYMARAFVQFSMEIDDDWSSLQVEMARLFADAKDDLEATAYTTGSGTSPNPLGITETANTAGIGTAAFVFTAGTAAFAVADVYSLEQALAPRWRPRASFVANRATYNKIRQFDTAGGANLWVDNLRLGLNNNVPTGGQIGSALLGYPTYESSVMASTPATTAAKTILFGDFSKFVIVDRIGMNVELVPQMFHTSNNLPNGARGLFARWRTGSTVTAPTAFKLLKVL